MKKINKKNIGNIIFCIIFVIMLLIPLVTMDFRKKQISEIDNQYLPDAPQTISANMFNEIDLYVNKRVGLRKESIDLYQVINDKFFGIMEHPLYMYGEEGHVFLKSDDYIKDYQHLNLDYDYVDEFVANINEFKDKAESSGRKFYYLLLPDKKTIYGDYFKKGVNVKGTTSRTDLILEKIENDNLSYLFPKEVLLKAKNKEAVYNIKYDAGHWNENGAFVVLEEFLQLIKKDFPGLKIAKKSDYNKTVKVEESLLVSRFKIHEEVPQYILKSNDIEGRKGYPDDKVLKEAPSYQQYVNEKNKEAPRILVFHDSYLWDKQKFFIPSFSETIFIHRDILTKSKKNYDYIVGLFDPDIVVYENCERVLPIEFNE